MKITTRGLSSEESDDDMLMTASEQVQRKLAPPKLWAVCALAGACLIITSCLLTSLGYGLRSSLQYSTHIEPIPSHLTLFQLLESDHLRVAVEDAALRLAAIAEKFEASYSSSGPKGTQRSGLSSSRERQLRQEAATCLRASVQKLLQDNPQAPLELSNLSITGDQGAMALSMLRSFTDERFLDLSIRAGEAIFGKDTGHRRSQHSGVIMDRLQEEVRKHGEEIRRLREELIPSNLHHLSDEVKQLHIKILRKKGAFDLHGDIAGWKSDVEVSKSRRLHGAQMISSKSQLSTPPPMAATQLPMDVPRYSNDPSPPIGIHPGFKGLTPLNYFTIGAPTISNLLGLVFLTLTALLPGRSGFPRNNPAQYAIWSLQGATTLGECLANLGFHKGIVYFSSCIIDVMFFGFDVAWVFFDGLPHNFPQRNVKCADFSQWPAIENEACGNCVALVPTAPYGGRCDRFCESFGHRCVFAAEEDNDDCTALSRFGCDESITNTRDMLCQCHGAEPAPPRCAAYSNWPSIQNTVCGDCTALVKLRAFGGSCNSYCESFGHRCVRAAEEEDDKCTIRRRRDCDDEPSSSDALCTCELRSDASAVNAINNPNCASYSEWPKIFENVCGSCEARVPSSTAVVDGKRYTTCEEYCKSFGHECQRAVDDTSCGADPDDVIPCNVQAEFRFQMCTCVLPGRRAVVTPDPTTPASTTPSTTRVQTIN